MQRKKYKTEYARGLALHDLIIDTCDYDEAEHQCTGYGALIDKRTVYSNYSATYQLLCNLIGLSDVELLEKTIIKIQTL